MSKPVRFGAQARPFALVTYVLGIGLPVLFISLTGGGFNGGTIILGGIAAAVVAVSIGPRRLEISDGRARILSGFVRMKHVLADGPVADLKLDGHDPEGGTLRGYQVDLLNESVWLSARAWHRLQDALRGQRMLGHG